jgi:hypothetical protein
MVWTIRGCFVFRPGGLGGILASGGARADGLHPRALEAQAPRTPEATEGVCGARWLGYRDLSMNAPNGLALELAGLGWARTGWSASVWSASWSWW